MPQTLTIGIFVLGAVMLLLALVSGGFRIFGSEMPGVANRSARIIAFVLGLVLVGFSLIHFREEPAAKGAGDRPATVAPSANAVLPSANAATNTGAAHPAADDHPAPKASQAEDNLNDPAAVRVFGREGMDFGVPPRNTIEENVGTLTPMTIPGARTITTGELYGAVRNNRRFLLVDVLDAPHAGLPGARRYPGVGMPVPSTDLAGLLDKDTSGDKAYPVVFYCQGPQCWESYNAALRARDAGFTNVYWYRGGLESWAMANLPGS
ncbi:MAG TPA: rhodanese-like domain-containing protein [Caulobacteraceae bacterium]|jgi:PQQ-dependent catabolism-associated CXXCW motif protein|nr:rhodanese-like domain-containing protein [Caulobacteraceae bacterium]